MKTSTHLLAKTLLLTFAIAAAAPATALDPATTGALATPANRIVGLWSVDGSLTRCDGQPGPTTRPNGMLLFNAGGTWTDTPRFPPGGINGAQRTDGAGVWSYNPLTGVYSARMRLFRFGGTPTAYVGYNEITREVTLSRDGNTFAGPARARIYAYDAVSGQHTEMPEICGTATSTRL